MTTNFFPILTDWVPFRLFCSSVSLRSTSAHICTHTKKDDKREKRTEKIEKNKKDEKAPNRSKSEKSCRQQYNNNRQILSFMEAINIVGEKMTGNGPKMSNS